MLENIKTKFTAVIGPVLRSALRHLPSDPKLRAAVVLATGALAATAAFAASQQVVRIVTPELPDELPQTGPGSPAPGDSPYPRPAIGKEALEIFVSGGAFAQNLPFVTSVIQREDGGLATDVPVDFALRRPDGSTFQFTRRTNNEGRVVGVVVGERLDDDGTYRLTGRVTEGARLEGETTFTVNERSVTVTEGGDVSVPGTVSAKALTGETITGDEIRGGTVIAGTLIGEGSRITGIDAGTLDRGTVSDTRLSGNVSLLGQSVGTSELEAGSVTSAHILDGTILNVDISPTAAIADTKLGTIATAGKVADTALSGNVPLRNAANVFTTNQTIQGQLVLPVQGTGGGLLLGGDTTLYRSAAGTLRTGGDLDVAGNLAAAGQTIGGDLDVTGATMLNTLSTSGNADFGANLAVTGAATLGSTLGVTGPITIGGDTNLYRSAANLLRTDDSFYVTGSQTVGADLLAGGTGTFRSGGAGQVIVASGAAAPTILFGPAGDTNLYRSAPDTLKTDDSLDVTGAAAVGGNQTVGGTLGVTGNTALGGTLGVTGATTLSNTLNVTGATTLAGLSAGASTLSSLGVTNNATVGGTFGVTGATTLSNTLNVTGATTLGSTLGVAGNFAVNTDKFTVAAASGNTAVGGTLGVTGATTLAGLSAGATTLSSLGVTNNATVGGTLDVTGALTAASISGDGSGITDLDASNITTGTLADARLSSNVALKNINNNFSTGQTVTNGDLQVSTGKIISGGVTPYSSPANGGEFFYDSQFNVLRLQNNVAAGTRAALNYTTAVAGVNPIDTFSVNATDGNLSLKNASNATTAQLGGNLVSGNAGLVLSDTNLYRSTANTLKTDDALDVVGSLSAGATTLDSLGVTNNATVGGTLDVTGALTAASLSGDGSGITNINASNITTGTLADARLSTNVPLKNVANTFTQTQTINGGYLNVLGSAAGGAILRGTATGDAQYRFQIDNTGQLAWGTGAGAIDTILYRSAANTLKTDDDFIVGGDDLYLGSTTGPRLQRAGADDELRVYTSGTAEQLRITASNLFAFSSNIIANSAGSAYGARLNIDPGSDSKQGIIVRGNSATQTADLLQLQDSTGVILTALDKNGKLVFGPSGAQDTNLYRSAANTLKTDDALDVAGALTAGSISGDGSGLTNLNASNITTGTLADARLSSNVALRNAANVFTANQTLAKTGTATNLTQYPSYDLKLTGSSWDTTLNAGAGGESVNNFKLRTIGETGAGAKYRLGVLNEAGTEVLTLREAGQLQLPTAGSAGGLLLGGDTNLYRSTANTLKTDDIFHAGGTIVSASGAAGQTQVGAVGPGSAGGLLFGVGGDTNLYRSAVNTLKTDDSLEVAGTLDAGATTLDSLNITGNASIAGTLDVAGASVLGPLSVTGNANFDGNVVLGNAGTDTITLNGVITSPALLQNAVDSTAALRVRNAAGTVDALRVDTVTGTVNTNALANAGNATVGGTLGVTGNTSLGGTLNVTGATTLAGTLNAGASTLSSLGVTNNATVGGTLGVTGATTLAGTLNAGASTLSSLGVTNNATVGGTLGVTGNLAVNTNKFTVDGATGNTTVAGNLNVGGAGTVTNTLTVTGATNLSTLNTSGAAEIGGPLTVTGALQPKTTNLYDLGSGLLKWRDGFFAGDVTVAGNLVTGGETINGDFAVTGATTLNTLSTSSNANIGGTLGVTGATTLAGLTAGATTLSSLGVTNNATVGGTLGVTGATTLSSSLGVAGDLAVNTNKFTVAALTGNTGIAGTVTIGGDTNLYRSAIDTLKTDDSFAVAGSQTVGGTLGVTGATTLAGLTAGATTLNSLGVTNNATVGGTLGVTGNTTLGGTLGAGATTLSSLVVTGSGEIGGTLGVTSNFAVNTNKFTVDAVTGNTGVAGTVTLGGDANLYRASANALKTDDTFDALAYKVGGVAGTTVANCPAGNVLKGLAATSGIVTGAASCSPVNLATEVTGVLPDVNLSENVALKNAPNIFTANQTLDKTGTATSLAQFPSYDLLLRGSSWDTTLNAGAGGESVNSFKLRNIGETGAGAKYRLGVLNQAGTETVTVKESGNVGIGTVSPAQPLHVSRATDGGQVLAVLENSQANAAASTNETTSLEYHFGGVLAAAVGAVKESDFTSAANQDAALRFFTMGDGTAAERLRITSSGNVGIGEANPTNKLQLAASTAATGGIGFGTDTNLYRSGTNLLQTDDDLRAAGIGVGVAPITNQIRSVGPILSGAGTANQVSLSWNGSGSSPGIAFGSGDDTNLYRAAANTLKTDDLLVSATGLAVGRDTLDAGVDLEVQSADTDVWQRLRRTGSGEYVEVGYDGNGATVRGSQGLRLQALGGDINLTSSTDHSNLGVTADIGSTNNGTGIPLTLTRRIDNALPTDATLLDIKRTNGSGAQVGDTALINFQQNNSVGSFVGYAQIGSRIQSATAGSESGSISFRTTDAGTSAERLRLSSDGKLEFGATQDTNLYRSAANTLKTDDALTVVGALTAGSLSGDGSGLTNLNASNITSGTLADARLSSNVALKNINNQFSTSQTINGGGNETLLTALSNSSTNPGSIALGRTAAEGRLGIAGTSGEYSTSAAPGDIVLRHDTAGQSLLLQTGTGAADIRIKNGQVGIEGPPANGKLTIGTDTTAASGGAYFGTDTNLYRSAGNTLKTDDTLEVAGTFRLPKTGTATSLAQFPSSDLALQGSSWDTTLNAGAGGESINSFKLRTIGETGAGAKYRLGVLNEAGTETVTVKESGNVGIGVANPAAKLDVNNSAGSNIALRTQGATGQDIQSWVHQNGTQIARVSSTGRLYLTNDGIEQTAVVANSFGGSTIGGAVLTVNTGGASNQGLIVRGAASQTADLQQWRNSSGAVLAKIRNDGLVAAPYVSNAADTGPYFNFGATEVILQNRGGASNNVFRVIGQPSQTGDLLQLQNSAGTILTSFDKDGKLVFGPSGAQDTNLYRSAANILSTDDAFTAESNLNANYSSSNRVLIGTAGGGGEAGLKFGSALDTNLYRSAADTLKTDDALTVVGALTASGGVSGDGSGITNINASNITSGTLADARLSSNVALKNAANVFTANQTLDKTGTATSLAQFPSYDLRLTGSSWDTTLNAGAGGESVNSFKLRTIGETGAGAKYRLGVLNEAGTETVTVKESGNVGIGEASPTNKLQLAASTAATGGIGFGTDTNLYRSGANALVTGGTFQAPNGFYLVDSNHKLTYDSSVNGPVVRGYSGAGLGRSSGDGRVILRVTTPDAGGTNTVQFNAPIRPGDFTTANTLNPAAVAQTIQGAPSQTADLLQFTNDGGTVLTAFDAAGKLVFGTDTNLYRSAVDTLKTDDALTVVGALTAGSVSGDGSGLTNLNASNITSGTLADARLSSNVPLKNAANSFTAAQTLDKTGTATSLAQFPSYDLLLRGSSWDTTLNAGAGGESVNNFKLRTIGETGAGAKYRLGVLNQAGTETVTVKESGNVGIGETNPTNKLQLAASTAATGGIGFGTDTNLYRSAANTLKTDDTLAVSGVLAVGQYVDFAGQAAGSQILYANAAGDGLTRFTIDNNGKIQWGPGVGTNVDTNLYRSAADTLKTDDFLRAGGNIAATHGGAGQVVIGDRGPSGQAGITFGSADDTNLYRSAANELKTDDSFRIASPSSSTPALQVNGATSQTSGDVVKIIGNSASTVGASFAANSNNVDFRLDRTADGNPTFKLGGADGKIEWGNLAGGYDTNLYRSQANQLKTDDAFVSGAEIFATSDLYARNGTAYQVIAGSVAGNAGLSFGSAADTNLYRSAANVLKTDDALTVVGALTAGSVSGDGSGLTNLNASNITSGTLADARLSSNVPLKNAANVFTANQTLDKTGTATSLAQFPSYDLLLRGSSWDTTLNAGAGGESVNSFKLRTIGETGAGAKYRLGVLNQAGTETVTVKESGNVGIGEANPTNKLQLAASTAATGGIGFGTDTNLYRSATNVLKTDDDFHAPLVRAYSLGTQETGGQDVYLDYGTGGNLYFRESGAAAFGRFNASNQLEFGTGGTFDTNLYRSAANTLKTDDSLDVAGTFRLPKTGTATSLAQFPSSDLALQGSSWDTTLNAGAGGESVNAFKLRTIGETGSGAKYRLGVLNEAGTETVTVKESGNVGIGEANPTNKLQLAASTAATGGIGFGTDTNLYRAAANTLKTDDALTVTGALTASGGVSGDGSGLTNLNASNIASGTLADARLSSNVPLKDAANTFTATNTFEAGTTGTVPAKVQGASGQTANLFQIRSVGGTSNNILSVNPQGTFTLGGPNAAALTIKAEGAWAPDGNAVISVGNIANNSIVTTGKVGVGTGSSSPGAELQVNADASTTVGQIIKGAASQTADLQQWQNSSGAILSTFDAAGNLRVGTGSGSGLLTLGTNTTTASGGMYFGTDTALYRGGANTLKTTGSFLATSDLGARYGDADYQVTIGSVAAAGQAAISFGGAGDTNLYRSSANNLKTDDSFDAAALKINGADINTAGTLTNVAYLNQANAFTANQTLGKTGTATSLAQFPSYDLKLTGSSWDTTLNAGAGGESVNSFKLRTLGETGAGAKYRLGVLNQAGTETVTVKESGNVGIGTTNPGASLAIARPGVPTQDVQLYHDGTANLVSTNALNINVPASNLFRINQGSGTPIAVGTTGNVGIGQVSPSNKLELAESTSSTGGIGFGTDTNLYRSTGVTPSAALKTDNVLHVPSGMIVGNTKGVYQDNLSTPIVTGTNGVGTLYFGQGAANSSITGTGTGAVNLNLSSSQSFSILGGNVGVGIDPTANKLQLAEATTAAGGIGFGTDTNLYRSAVNTLKTDDALTVVGALTAGSISGDGSGLTNLNASNITTGTLADARLSSNVPLKNAANVFTAAQTLDKTGTATSLAQYPSYDLKLTGSSWDTTLNAGAGGESVNNFKLRTIGESGAGAKYRLGVLNQAGTETVTVKESGNVGIGMTNPDDRLDVAGNIQATGQIYSTALLTAAAGGTSIRSDGATALYLARPGAVSVTGRNNADTADLTLFQKTTGDSLALMPTSGNVGIGETVPGAKLQVSTGAAGTIGQIIKGAASQTADLQQWQNSSGQVLGFFSPFATGGGEQYGLGINLPDTNRKIGFFARSTGLEGGIRADSELYQRAGATIYLQPNGLTNWAGFRFGSRTNPTGWSGTYNTLDAGGGSILYGEPEDTNEFVNIANPIVARQQSGRTADLLQLQNSAGTILTAIQSDGKLVFGPSGAQDTNLYRSAANTLKTDDELHSGGAFVANDATAQQVRLVSVGGLAGIDFGTAGDTNLYRPEANVLRTDDGLQAAQLIQSDVDLIAQRGAATQVRIGERGSGGIPGIDIGTDTNLYRSAANTLKTDDTFNAAALQINGTDINTGGTLTNVAYKNQANVFTANQALDKTGTATSLAQFPSYDLKLTGSSWDTTLNAGAGGESVNSFKLRTIGETGAGAKYRLGVLNEAGTETVTVKESGNVGIGEASPTNKLQLAASTAATGGIGFGTDTNLYRSAANTLRTSDNLTVDSDLTVTNRLKATNYYANGTGIAIFENLSAQPIVRVGLAGPAGESGVGFAAASGGATDTNLYRNAANELKTDDALTVVGALTAGSVSGDGSGITNINASNITSGTLADARLSSNVPLKDAANTFTATNTFEAGTTGTVPAKVQGASGQTANLFQIRSVGGTSNNILSVNPQGTFTLGGPNAAALTIKAEGAWAPDGNAVISVGNIANNSIVTTGKVGVGTGSSSPGAELQVNADASTTVGQIIKGAASQTADLLELQQSTGYKSTAFDASGKLQFADGTGGAVDTNLYRSAANTLKTDDSLQAANVTLPSGGTLASDGVLYLKSGATNDQTIFLNSASAERARFNSSGDFVFGPSNKLGWSASAGTGTIDTNLYRASADTLRTDDSLNVGNALRVDQNDLGNQIIFGSAQDTNLYRSGANTLKTDDDFLSSMAIIARSGGSARVDVGDLAGDGVTPSIEFGTTGDTNLYRSAANTLKTDDTLEVAGTARLPKTGTATSLTQYPSSDLELQASSWDTTLNAGAGGESVNSFKLRNIGETGAGAKYRLGVLNQAGTETVTVKESGNVGIGATGPQAILDANGSILARGLNTPTSGKYARLAYDTGGDYGDILSYDSSAATFKQLRLRGSSVILNGSNEGNVGIGDAAPSTRLALGGTGTANGIVLGDDTASPVNLYRNGVDQLKTDDTFDAAAYKVGGTAGATATCTGGQVYEAQVISGGIVTSGTCTGNAPAGGWTDDGTVVRLSTSTDAVGIGQASVAKAKLVLNGSNSGGTGTDIDTTGTGANYDSLRLIAADHPVTRWVDTAEQLVGAIGPDGGKFQFGTSGTFSWKTGMTVNGNLWSSPTERMTLDSNGQLSVLATGSTGGLAIGNDTNLYDNGVNLLKTDDTFDAAAYKVGGVAGAAGTCAAGEARTGTTYTGGLLTTAGSCSAVGGGSGGWTDDGTVVRLSTSTDQVGIGTSTPTAGAELEVANNSGADAIISRGTGTSAVESSLTISGARNAVNTYARLDFNNYDLVGTAAEFTGARIAGRNDGADDAALYFYTATDKVLQSASSPALKIDKSAQSTFTASGVNPGAFNRTTSDGTIVSLQQGGIEEGTISVSGTTVSYNAFTGSHYADAQERGIDEGMLVTQTGRNGRLGGRKDSELLYGVKRSVKANDPAVMGAYLAVLNPKEPGKGKQKDRPESASNPSLVMAVGNGDVWVADAGEGAGKDLKPGDNLISSGVAGHAMRDDGSEAVSHVVAKVAEPVKWEDVKATVDADGKKVKRAKVSVFFSAYDKTNEAATRDELEKIEGKADAAKTTADEVGKKVDEAAAETKRVEETAGRKGKANTDAIQRLTGDVDESVKELGGKLDDLAKTVADLAGQVKDLAERLAGAERKADDAGKRANEAAGQADDAAKQADEASGVAGRAGTKADAAAKQSGELDARVKDLESKVNAKLDSLSGEDAGQAAQPAAGAGELDALNKRIGDLRADAIAADQARGAKVDERLAGLRGEIDQLKQSRAAVGAEEGTVRRISQSAGPYPVPDLAIPAVNRAVAGGVAAQIQGSDADETVVLREGGALRLETASVKTASIADGAVTSAKFKPGRVDYRLEPSDDNGGTIEVDDEDFTDIGDGYGYRSGKSAEVLLLNGRLMAKGSDPDTGVGVRIVVVIDGKERVCGESFEYGTDWSTIAVPCSVEVPADQDVVIKWQVRVGGGGTAAVFRKSDATAPYVNGFASAR